MEKFTKILVRSTWLGVSSMIDSAARWCRGGISLPNLGNTSSASASKRRWDKHKFELLFSRGPLLQKMIDARKERIFSDSGAIAIGQDYSIPRVQSSPTMNIIERTVDKVFMDDRIRCFEELKKQYEEIMMSLTRKQREFIEVRYQSKFLINQRKLSLKETALEMGISIDGAKYHSRRIFGKLLKDQE